jgi:hypothetical protein
LVGNSDDAARLSTASSTSNMVALVLSGFVGDFLGFSQWSLDYTSSPRCLTAVYARRIANTHSNKNNSDLHAAGDAGGDPASDSHSPEDNLRPPDDNEDDYFAKLHEFLWKIDRKEAVEKKREQQRAQELSSAAPGCGNVSGKNEELCVREAPAFGTYGIPTPSEDEFRSQADQVILRADKNEMDLAVNVKGSVLRFLRFMRDLIRE